MFQVVANHWELIFFPFTSLKCETGKFEKAMFQGVAWHSQLIFGLCYSPKSDESSCQLSL